MLATSAPARSPSTRSSPPHPADSTPKLRAPTVLANTVADQKDKDATAGLATPARHAAKANDNNPVSTAIKAIKEASKGSYVGRHCADAAGAKASAHNGEDGSKGSNGK